MATVRKRVWQSGGEEKTARVATYADQHGKRHLRTFETRKTAQAWLVETQGEVARGVHTPQRESVTVAEGAKLWLERGQAEQLKRGTLRG